MLKELTGDEIKVTASYSRKVQLVQYADSVDIGCFLSTIAKSEKEFDKTYDRLYKKCEDKVDARIKEEFRIKESRGSKFAKHKEDFLIEEGTERPIGE